MAKKTVKKAVKKRSPSKEELLKPKRGRPTEYTKELGDAICEQLADGISLRTVLLGKGMPQGMTVFRWMRENEDFRKQYESAKEESADAMLEDMFDLADKSIVESNKGDAKRAGAKVAAHRLAVDTRKWAASKLKPKRYGDKLDLTSDGKQLKGNTIVLKSFDGKGTGTQSDG